MAGTSTLLIDNGSLEPTATLALRELAVRLAAQLGQPVAPVSLLHSSGIDPKLIGGEPAEILFLSLERRLAAGENDFILVPLFFGPSGALTEYIPENVARVRKKHPRLQIAMAPPLHAAGDDRLARIMAEHIVARLGPEPARVALVDHGSPVAEVTAMRNELARQVAERLGARVAAVAPCSMERRPEPAYDFCAPLLADLLAAPRWNADRVIVAMQFLLPGRHAGAEGDVAQICRAAEAAHPGLKTQATALVGAHPLLVEILADRWRAAVPLV